MTPMIRTRPMTLLGLLAALALVLAACGDGGGTATPAGLDDETPEPAAQTEEAEETGPPATDEEDGDGEMTATVTISGFSFGADLTVEPGTTVTFVNEDDAPHTVTEGEGGQPAEGARFDQNVGAGGQTNVTFDEPGEYPITCKLHPSMQMTVTVEG
jgi:plastocyanin